MDRTHLSCSPFILRSFSEGGPEFLGHMRREGRQYLQETDELVFVDAFLFCDIRERHHRRNGGIELERLYVTSHFQYRFVQLPLGPLGSSLFVACPVAIRAKRGCGTGVRSLSQPPHAFKESPRAYHALRAPRDRIGEGPHEHFVHAERVGAVGLHDVVGIYHVAVALAHLLSVWRLDESDGDQTHERLVSGNDADVVQEFVPKARVDKVARRVLRAAHIGVYRCPVFLFFLIDERFFVVRVHVAQVVPRRTRPLWHRVGLARTRTLALRTADVDPFRNTRKRRA